MNILTESERKIPLATIDEWANDEEHGAFHGLSTLFAIAMHSPRMFGLQNTIDFHTQEISQSETFIVSVLLHDIGRFIQPYKHDKVLKNIIPGMLPIVFTHSEPKQGTDQHPLVVGDRLELRRFDDFDEWVKPELMPQSNDMLDCYYVHVRPALNAIYHKRYDTWIKFGPEYKTKKDSMIGAKHFPLPETWDPSNDVKLWPCEIGTPLNHIFAKHTDVIWEQRYGLLPLSRLFEHNGTLVNDERDHPYCGAKIPFDQWVYCHKTRIHNDHFIPGVLVNGGVSCHETLAIKMLEVTELITSFVKGLMGK
jgi:hypothetical protein